VRSRVPTYVRTYVDLPKNEALAATKLGEVQQLLRTLEKERAAASRMKAAGMDAGKLEGMIKQNTAAALSTAGAVSSNMAATSARPHSAGASSLLSTLLLCMVSQGLDADPENLELLAIWAELGGPPRDELAASGGTPSMAVRFLPPYTLQT
jgi:hypothetical protein